MVSKVKNEKDYKIELYPNPASSYAILKIEGRHDKVLVKITNEHGEEMSKLTYHNNVNMISLNSIKYWKEGEYNIIVEIDHIHVIKQLIIKK